ncbi:MAG: diguanylate cyclase [Candidatus Omnitrophota bacterium]
MKHVLIAEDSKMMAAMISRRIRSDLKFERDIACSLKEARELVEADPDRYFLAIVDLHLPDAPKGEIVDYVLDKKIPVIVFTSQFSDEIRETMWTKNVVDYIVKEGGPQVIDYLIASIDRFYKNQFSKIMIVDDSGTSRRSIKELLEAQKFVVIEASKGSEAIALLDEHPDTKIIITDYNMPGMDGFELVNRVRQNYPKDKLAIIGMSAYGTSLLSARFLKNGASDFITKPFLEEELLCRISQNIEMLEHIQMINNISSIDYLTGIYNRSYLFRFGQKLFENAKRGNLHLTIAMIDIDRLKPINEEFGYETGDVIVKEIAQLLNRNFRAADVITRFGGEQFCVMASNMDRDYTEVVFERIRAAIERKKIVFDRHTFSVTASIGVSTKIADSLDAMIKYADSLRIRAKEKGRNCVIVD